MRQIGRILAAIVALAVASLWMSPALAEAIPDQIGYVNDFADVIGNDTERDFEKDLRLYHATTGIQVVVVAVPNIDGTPIQDYARRVSRKWHIGGDDVDNGVLLLVVRQDRSAYVDVGYGIEPFLPAAQVSRILESQVMAEVGQDHYYLGLDAGVVAIKQVLKDSTYQIGWVRPRPAATGVARQVADMQWGFFIAGAASLYVVAFAARTRWVGATGAWGAVVGGALGWISGGLLGAALGIAIAGGLGLALAVALSRAYQYQSRSGKPTTWAQSWGGFHGVGRSGLRGRTGRR